MTDGNENHSKRSKPAGIIILAIYFAIANGLIAVAFSVLLLFISNSDSPSWVSLMSVITLAAGVLSLSASYALWMLMEWGRKLAVAISAFSIPLNIIPLIFARELKSGDYIVTSASITIDVVIIWYLLRNNIKSLFPK